MTDLERFTAALDILGIEYTTAAGNLYVEVVHTQDGDLSPRAGTPHHVITNFDFNRNGSFKGGVWHQEFEDEAGHAASGC